MLKEEITPDIQEAISDVGRSYDRLSNESFDFWGEGTADQELHSPSARKLKECTVKLEGEFDEKKETIISILTIYLENSPDDFLSRKVKEIRDLSIPKPAKLMEAVPDIQEEYQESGAMSRNDLRRLLFLIYTPVSIYSNRLVSLVKLTRRCVEHLKRKQSRLQEGGVSVPRKVFIGHGRSPVWRELKDYIEDVLELEVVEFDEVATAGMDIQDRLNQMLKSANFAILVMTGEDKQPDGTLRARQNVVHELGLFQARLGPERSVVLLEQGCEKPSNINGQVLPPFPKGHIKMVFSDVHKALKREGLL